MQPVKYSLRGLHHQLEQIKCPAKIIQTGIGAGSKFRSPYRGILIIQISKKGVAEPHYIAIAEEDETTEKELLSIAFQQKNLKGIKKFFSWPWYRFLAIFNKEEDKLYRLVVLMPNNKKKMYEQTHALTQNEIVVFIPAYLSKYSYTIQHPEEMKNTGIALIMGELKVETI